MAKMVRFFMLVFILGLSLSEIANGVNDGSLVEVELGKPFSLDLKKLGQNILVVRRETKDSKKPQLLFVSPNSKRWKTEGTDKLGSHDTILHPNGTLQFSKILEEDLGTYSLPLDPVDPKNAHHTITLIPKQATTTHHTTTRPYPKTTTTKKGFWSRIFG